MTVFLTVLVTNLKDVSVEDLKNSFGVTGIRDAEIPMRPNDSGGFKLASYGFITFEDEYYLNLALVRIPPVINGLQLNVQLCRMDPRVPDVFEISELPPKTTAHTLNSIFKNYNIKAIQFKDKNRALIKCQTRQDRDAAIAEMNKKTVGGIALNLAWAKESF